MKITTADAAFSLCVRERAGWRCERCGTQYRPPTKALHCAHFKGRGRMSTRFDANNAAALCYGCHRFIDTHESDKNDFFGAMLGFRLQEHIERRSNQPAHGIRRELPEIAKHYREEYKRMRTWRAEGIEGRLEFVSWQ